MSAIEPRDTEKYFLCRLADGQAEFLVVGGYALLVHGLEHSPADLDVLIARRGVNARKVVRVIKQVEPSNPVTEEFLL